MTEWIIDEFNDLSPTDRKGYLSSLLGFLFEEYFDYVPRTSAVKTVKCLETLAVESHEVEESDYSYYNTASHTIVLEQALGDSTRLFKLEVDSEDYRVSNPISHLKIVEVSKEILPIKMTRVVYIEI